MAFCRFVDRADQFLSLERLLRGNVRLNACRKALIEILDLLDVGNTPIRTRGLPCDRHGDWSPDHAPLGQRLKGGLRGTLVKESLVFRLI